MNRVVEFIHLDKKMTIEEQWTRLTGGGDGCQGTQMCSCNSANIISRLLLNQENWIRGCS